MDNINNFSKLINDVKALEKRVSKLYVYGAGFFGKDFYKILTREGINIEGFAITSEVDDMMCCEKKVVCSKELFDDDVGFVLAMSKIYTSEVVEYLLSNGIGMERIIDAGIYETIHSGRDDYNKGAVLEITLIVGCSINCKYCPQDKLVNKYYECRTKDSRAMTVDVFKKILKNTTQDTELMFAGMGEPFLDPECMDILELAVKSGRRVSLFTTLEGASISDVERLIRMPIDFCTLHVADNHGYAHIEINEQYYRKLELIINAKKENGEPFVGYANAQGEPDKRVAKICGNRLSIMESLQDRAGNVEAEGIEKRKEVISKNSKVICGCVGPDFNSNVVLPDGTLLLCQSDYGMQHVIGNLTEETINEIREGVEFRRIIDSANCKNDMDLLCRRCLLARIVE